MSPTEAPARVLVVCTANRCRSPMAAALLERRAAERRLAVQVGSAGLLDAGHLDAGLAVPEVGVAIARRHGLDLGAHRSRRLDRGQLLAADLVVTMTRQQAREVDDLAPERRPRVFPLRQLVGWLDRRGPAPAYADLGAWLDTVAADRPAADLLGAGGDDVADPMGHGRLAWTRMMRTLDRAVPRILDGLEPALRPRPLTDRPRLR